jgi:hypothetical protein
MHMKIFAILYIFVGLRVSSGGEAVSTNAPQSAAQSPTSSRAYRIDTNAFAIMRLSLTTTNALSEIDVLRSFCKQKGVDLSRPVRCFYTYGEKTLVVWATSEKLERLGKVLADLRPAK